MVYIADVFKKHKNIYIIGIGRFIASWIRHVIANIGIVYVSNTVLAQNEFV